MKDKEHLNKYARNQDNTISFMDIIFLIDHGYILLTPIVISLSSISLAATIVDTTLCPSYSSQPSIILGQTLIVGTSFLIANLFYILLEIISCFLGGNHFYYKMLRLQAVIYKYISVSATFVLTFLSISVNISCETQLLFLIVFISCGVLRIRYQYHFLS